MRARDTPPDGQTTIRIVRFGATDSFHESKIKKIRPRINVSLTITSNHNDRDL